MDEPDEPKKREVALTVFWVVVAILALSGGGTLLAQLRAALAPPVDPACKEESDWRLIDQDRLNAVASRADAVNLATPSAATPSTATLEADAAFVQQQADVLRAVSAPTEALRRLDAEEIAYFQMLADDWQAMAHRQPEPYAPQALQTAGAKLAQALAASRQRCP
jgi:hypothetical protein